MVAASNDEGLKLAMPSISRSGAFGSEGILLLKSWELLKKKTNRSVEKGMIFSPKQRYTFTKEFCSWILLKKGWLLGFCLFLTPNGFFVECNFWAP